MVEIIRMVAAALAHATYGVNAQLDTLQKYAADSTPPDIVRVLAITDDGEAVETKRSLDFPILVVSFQSPVESDREFGVVLRDSTSTPVHIDIVMGGVDTGPSARNTLYYIRAILRCLKDFMETANEADQNENGIMLMTINRVVWGPANHELPAGRIVGTVVPEFFVRDTLP